MNRVLGLRGVTSGVEVTGLKVHRDENSEIVALYAISELAYEKLMAAK